MLLQLVNLSGFSHNNFTCAHCYVSCICVMYLVYDLLYASFNNCYLLIVWLAWFLVGMVLLVTVTFVCLAWLYIWSDHVYFSVSLLFS